MATFRLRTPAEYLGVLWEKRAFVIVPALIVAGALAYAVRKLPNIYESRSLVLVDPPKVSSNYVQPVSTLDVNSRLASIQKMITSRSELVRLIERFDLYPELRKKSTPIEEVVNVMVKNINVRQTAAPQTINSFTVSYQNERPDKARDVTSELAARIINANSDRVLTDTYQTVDLLEERVKNVREQLEKIEAERARFYTDHPDASPNQEQSLIGQLNALSMNRQTQQSSIDSLRNQIQANEQMIAALQSQVEIEPDTPIATGQTEGTLRARRAELDGKLKNLLTTYTEKAPEVKEVRALIESIDAEIADVKKNDQQDKQVKRVARSNNSGLQVQQLRVKIEADKRDLDIKQKDLESINTQITNLRGRLGVVPSYANEALKIERDYNTLHRRYEDLLKDLDNARFSAKITNDFNGETFRLIDPANMPEQPVSPRRELLYPLALVLGLAVGLLAASAAAVRELMTIRDARDVAHYTRLPMLASVPRLVTEAERRLQPVINVAKVLAAVVLIALATPLLYQLIRLSGLLAALARTSN